MYNNGRPVSFSPGPGSTNIFLSGQVLARQGSPVGQKLFGRPFKNHLPTFYACARPHINHVVRFKNRLRIMLHNEHGISKVSELFQISKKPEIISLMKPDTRFIQHIQYTGQP